MSKFCTQSLKPASSWPGPGQVSTLCLESYLYESPGPGFPDVVFLEEAFLVSTCLDRRCLHAMLAGAQSLCLCLCACLHILVWHLLQGDARLRV